MHDNIRSATMRGKWVDLVPAVAVMVVRAAQASARP